MSVTYCGECPHCGKKDVAFTGRAVTASKRKAKSVGASVWNVYMTCNHCGEPIALVVEAMRAPDQQETSISGKEGWMFPQRLPVSVLDTYPAPPVPDAPADAPERIAQTFIEAQQDLHVERYETCEMLCRKVLDLATGNLKPNIDSLSARINALRQDGTITPAMADWAHIVRMDGNESVHSEDETTPERAKELVSFTRAFLLYAYTLPAMVAKRRAVPV